MRGGGKEEVECTDTREREKPDVHALCIYMYNRIIHIHVHGHDTDMYACTWSNTRVWVTEVHVVKCTK